jgi:hypothetical protein
MSRKVVMKRSMSLCRAPLRRAWVLVALMGASALSGCGLAAAPCRIASAGLKIVPLVGHAAATPTDACATALDP